MAITNFIPKLWSAAVQLPFEKGLVYGQPTVANRKYEGEISQQGDTVHITTIGDPTIRTYDKSADITVEDISDGRLSLVIDQGDYFAFRVNDVDKVQAAGDFQGPATSRAGYGLKDKLDIYLAGLLKAGAQAGNQVGRVTVVNDGGTPGAGQASPLAVLASLAERLDASSAPTDGRYVVVPPAFITALRLTKNLSSVDEAGTSETLRNGLVTRLYGLDVLVSNNVQKVGGAGANKDDLVIVAGIADAFTVAQQIVETEALRSQGRFADIVRGLHVYGAKVTRPDGIATATATFAAHA